MRTPTKEARLAPLRGGAGSSHWLMEGTPGTPRTDGNGWLTVCGRPVRGFRGPVSWCGECHDHFLSGVVPRICEPWDADPTPPEERYSELFRAAETVWRAGIADENQIIPTLVFAARSFELQNLGAIREQLARVEVGSERLIELKGMFRRAFDTFEIVGIHDGVPIVYSKPFKLRAHAYPETGIVEKVVIEVYRRSAKGEDIAKW
jgi:hypothetical protein